MRYDAYSQITNNENNNAASASTTNSPQIEAHISNACISALRKSNLFDAGKDNIEGRVNEKKSTNVPTQESNINARLISFEDYNDFHCHVQLAVSEEGTRKIKKVHTIRRSPEQMAKMSLRNIQLIISDSENPFKKVLLHFLSSKLPASANDRLKHTFNTTSNTIRSLLTNIAPTQSINDLAHTDEIVTTLLPKEHAKEVGRSKDLLPHHKLKSYSCNWCESHVSNEDNIRPVHETLAKFKEEVTDINVHRLQIFFDEETILEHILTDHIRAAPDTLDTETFHSVCCMVFPCRICFSGYIRDSEKHPIHNIFCCSLECYFDHLIQVPIHQDNPLVSLIINLRAQFANDHRILGLVDKYFQIMCPICAFAAQDQTSLLSHFKVCVTQVMALSQRYAIPWDYDAFFLTPFMRKKEQQACQETAYIQMARFVEAIKITYRRTPNTSNILPHLAGKVRSLKDVEAEFASPSTSRHRRSTDPTYQQNTQDEGELASSSTCRHHTSRKSVDQTTDQQGAQNSEFFEDDIDFANEDDQIRSQTPTSSAYSPPSFSPPRITTPTRSSTDNIDYDSDNSVICLDDLQPLPAITDTRILSLLDSANTIVKTEARSPVSSPPKKKTRSQNN